MPQFEFRKIDLNNTPKKMTDVDLLNEAGTDGWRVTCITPNHVAYMEREVPKVRSRAENALQARSLVPSRVFEEAGVEQDGAVQASPALITFSVGRAIFP